MGGGPDIWDTDENGMWPAGGAWLEKAESWENTFGQGCGQGHIVRSPLWLSVAILWLKCLHCDHCRSYAKNEQVCVHACVNENIGGTELGFRNEITLICFIVLNPWIWKLDIPTLLLCLWLLQSTGPSFSPRILCRLKVQIVKKGRAMWRALKKCFKDTLKPGIGAHTYLCFLSPHSRSLYLSARRNVHLGYFYQYLLHLWKASGTAP